MITIVKEDKFRSQPGLNHDYDMVRVTIDLPIWEWRKLKNHILHRFTTLLKINKKF